MASTEPLLDADPDPEIFDCEQLPVTLDPESRSHSVTEHHHVYHALGSKQLGTMLSIMFIVNQIYGPGVLAIPLVYQQAGVVSTLIMLAFFFVASCFSSTMLVAAMTAIPGNSKFEKRMEFGSVVGHYYGPRWKVAFDILLNLTLQAYNIASIVICAQSIDQFVIYVGGHTYALEFWPSFGFHSFSDITVLYSSAVLTMSLGYIIIMLMCIPMSMLNLDDNVKVVQTASFVFLAVLCVEFCAYFIFRAAEGDWHGLPAFGSNNTQLVSVFIFSWAFTMFIPSWVCQFLQFCFFKSNLH
jgi:amino acid permease